MISSRDWNPHIVDVRIESQKTVFVLHCHTDDEDYLCSVQTLSDIADSLFLIKDRLDSNRDRLPLGFDVESFLRELHHQMEILFRLHDGSWKNIVMDSLDNEIAGEDELKLLLFYSGLSAGLSTKLHVYIMGESQMGKSFVASKTGHLLFGDRLILASTMSGKAAYGMAVDNPTVFRNKILMLDELKDLSEDTRATVKAMASNDTEILTVVCKMLASRYMPGVLIRVGAAHYSN